MHRVRFALTHVPLAPITLTAIRNVTVTMELCVTMLMVTVIVFQDFRETRYDSNHQEF